MLHDASSHFDVTVVDCVCQELKAPKVNSLKTTANTRRGEFNLYPFPNMLCNLLARHRRECIWSENIRFSRCCRAALIELRRGESEL